MPELADHIARIAQDEALPQRVKEAARQTAVLTVLDALGWDCWDGNEVTPEFEVRAGRVDYCLQVPGQRLVLIEVKRTGTDLTGHQEQLLRYAFDEGVPLAALTDGRVWWLYLPTAAGNWEQRRFFNIDFRQQEAASAAAALERFLSREGVASGTALREAQREFESQERDRRVRAALQDAWKQVLGDPDGLLRDLLAETVKEISGHQPDPETVAGFLQGISGRSAPGASTVTWIARACASIPAYVGVIFLTGSFRMRLCMPRVCNARVCELGAGHSIRSRDGSGWSSGPRRGWRGGLRVECSRGWGWARRGRGASRVCRR